MKATITFILAVIAQFAFADGLVKTTYVCITQDCSSLPVPHFVVVNGVPYTPAVGRTFPKGMVLEFLGYTTAAYPDAVVRLNGDVWAIHEPQNVISMIPPENSDYAQAGQIYANEVAEIEKRIAAEKNDQQNAATTDAIKNPNVTVHIDNP